MSVLFIFSERSLNLTTKFLSDLKNEVRTAKLSAKAKERSSTNVPAKTPMVPSTSAQNTPKETFSRRNNYQKQLEALQAKERELGDEINNEVEYIEYVSYDEYDPDDEEGELERDEVEASSLHDDSSSLLHMATPNPVSEFKIVNVTSLPAEKHNEIMNNDDNAMNSMDVYDHDTHHPLTISDIISTTSNSNVFGIAKKSSEPESLLSISNSKPYDTRVPNKSLTKKTNSRIQKMRQQMQNNYRFASGSAIQNFDDGSSSSPVRKEGTDSDEHSNSKFNSKMSRRKNTLTPLDCEMEFEEVQVPIMKKQAHMTDAQRLLSSQLETVKRINNPNSDLLRKVAFLRVCVNYMMTELEGEPFHFGKNITFETLKTKYNSKRMA